MERISRKRTSASTASQRRPRRNRRSVTLAGYRIDHDIVDEFQAWMQAEFEVRGDAWMLAYVYAFAVWWGRKHGLRDTYNVLQDMADIVGGVQIKKDPQPWKPTRGRRRRKPAMPLRYYRREGEKR